ncbi:MAG: cadherin-like beta sandwich domain-containing protein [Verrucomicrobiaceae bacterium]|nr:cadherin-like beta sandwich domain-containing protein [Verrucomicrobiaceae bacterium]
MKTLLISSSALLWLGFTSVHAAPGALDSSFGTNGKVVTSINDWDDGYAVVVQGDGKVVVGGSSYVPGTREDFAVLRYNSNGTLDSSFGSGGRVLTDFNGELDEVHDLAIQSDGKIVAAGIAENTSGDLDFAVVRYNASGSLDTGFGTSGKVSTAISSITDYGQRVAIQSDGKILVAGFCTNSVNTNLSDFAVVRYLSNGSLDSSFGTGGKVVTTVLAGYDNSCYGMALQADGKIILGGDAYQSNLSQYALVRYNSDGSLDTSFNSTGKVTTAIGVSSTCNSVAVLADGRIVAAGRASVSGSVDFAVARYNANGSLDTTFNTTGKVTTPVGAGSDTGTSTALQSDGKILVAGESTTAGNVDFTVTRYQVNGALDTSFGTGGKVTVAIGSGYDGGRSVAIPAGGNILVVGTSVISTGVQDFALIQLLGDKPPVVTLGASSNIVSTTATLSGTANPNGITTTAQFEYGTTISYGSTASVTLSPSNGTSAQNVSANLSSLTSGTLYHYRLTATNAAGASSTSDGTFTTLSSNANLSALTFSSGSLSPPFAPGTISYTAAVSFSTTSVTITPTRQQANATITVNGSATASGTASVPVNLTVGDNAIPVIVTAQDGTTIQTYNVTVTRAATAGPGDRDFSFGTQGIVTTPIGNGDDSAEGVVVQPDGKIIAVGYTIDGSNNDDFAVVRYNADGSPDTSFGTGCKVITPFGSEDDDAFAVALQSDGKIVVAGRSASGTHRFAVARYNTDGSPDGSFGTGGKVVTPVIAGDYAYSVAIQTDGKIVVAGRTVSAGTEDIALVRYTSAGVPDSSFGTGGKVITPIGTGDESAQEVKLQSDGKIIVAGFSHNGSNWDFALVRYNSDGSRDSSFGTDGKATTPISGSSNDYAYSIAIQPDGKFIVAGSTEVGGGYDSVLVRYTTSGIPDTTFNGTGKLVIPLSAGYDELYEVALQSDGKILAAGYAGTPPNSDFALLRYHADGTPDNSFYGTGKVITPVGSGNDIGKALAVQPNGRVVVAGISNNGSNNDFALVRYLGDLRPVVGLAAATGVTATTATLNATVNPNESVTAAQFDFGLTAAYGSSASVILTPNDGSSPQNVSANLTGLTRGTLYHYRLTATNSAGTSNTTDGTFVTLSNNANLSALSLSTGTLSPSFSAATTAYSASVPYYVGSITVTPVKADANATITVNGTPVSSGTASVPIPLTPGANMFTVMVTAQDASTKSYSVLLTRGESFPTVGLVARYRFNGNANDSVGTLHGTVSGAVPAPDRLGRPGSAYFFNGTSNYIEIPDSDAFSATTTGHLTISAWVRPDGTSLDGSNNLLFSAKEGTGYVHWMGKGMPGQHEWAMRIYSADNTDMPSRVNRMSSYLFNPAGGTGAGSYFQDALTAGQWIHCLAVINTATQRITWFKNGVQRDQDTFDPGSSFPVTPGNGSAPLRIGTRDFNSVFAGAVDDLRIYNRGLTGTEILALYHEDEPGSIDPDFGTTGIVGAPIGTSNDYGHAVAVQADGKTVVAGFIDSATINDFAVARFNTDGTPDASFGTGGKVTIDFFGDSDYGRAVALQPDGKIIVVGQAYTGGRRFFALARLTTTGQPDPSLTGGIGRMVYEVGTSIDDARAVAIQPDGRIILAGSSYNGSNHDFAVVRLLTNGTLDGTFGTNGKQTSPIGSGDDFGLGVALQTDGRIVVAGSTLGSNYDFAVARYTTNGTLDTTFNTTGKAVTTVSSGNDEAYGVVVQGDGKIVVGGYAGSYPNSDFALVRYNSDGSLDTATFGSGTGKVTTNIGGGNDGAYGLAIQRDGKLMLAGFSHNGSNNDFALARYNVDGSADSTFYGTGKTTTALGSSDDQGMDVALQSDGSIMVAGYAWNGRNYDFALVKYIGDIDGVQQGWRQLYFGTSSNTGNAADSFDYDKDGLPNLIEWACNLNPTAASPLPITTTLNGAVFEFTYTRSVSALNAGATFTVEWSDTLPGTSWSSVGVTEQLLSDNGTVQQVKASLPAGTTGHRFVRLKVMAPP